MPLDFDKAFIDSEAIEFISWLMDNDKLGTAHSLLYLLEKPWKYRAEYAEFQASVRPEPIRTGACWNCGGSGIRCCEYGRDQ
jgi:hypothetical protein